MDPLIRIPGMMPPMKRAGRETLAVAEKTTMAELGGMTIPVVPAAATVAVERSLG